MANAPAFASTPVAGLANVAAANTARDGTGTLVTVLTGAATGTKISEVVVDATVTTTAGMIRLFVFDGTNNRMYDEIPVLATTVSASVPAFRRSRFYDNLVLPSSSWVLKCTSHNAESINVMAFGASL